MPSFELPWGAMAYTDTGDSDTTAATMVFVHGTGCDAADWAEVCSLLPASVRRIVLEFRGHGESGVPTEPFAFSDLADDVIRFIEAKKLKRVILIGHSLGGMVGMDVARQCGEVAVLVLLEGWTRLGCSGKAFEGERFYGKLGKAIADAIRQKSEATRARFEPVVWEQFWESVREFNGFAFLTDARVPIVEVYGGMGRKDGSEAALLVPRNPYIQTMWIPDAGHYLPLEAPRDVAKLCADMTEFV